MRVYNPPRTEIHADIAAAVAAMRAERSFDAQVYVQQKAQALNRYMAKHRLAHCVVGTSGGVDSAVVLAIAARAQALASSPIDKVIALLMPVHDEGATGQDTARTRGELVAKAVGAQTAHVDLTGAMTALTGAVEKAVGIAGEAWARGQVVSYLRTPALYYTTSLLTQDGAVGIVLGTTNLDEGGYLGYFGKASDGMVDLQMISDLHKSEVYNVARVLGLPPEVIDVEPSGDMYDGRLDEEVFGAPYDFVELYMQWLRLDEPSRQSLTTAWSDAARQQFDAWSENLERMHRYNGHKYLGRSPAVHLDLFDVAVPGGWRNPAEAAR